MKWTSQRFMRSAGFCMMNRRLADSVVNKQGERNRLGEKKVKG